MIPLPAALSIGAFGPARGVAVAGIYRALIERLQAALGALIARGAFLRLEGPFFGGLDVRQEDSRTDR